MTKNHADAIRVLNKVTNQKGPPPSQFHIKEQVWLNTSHLKLPHQKVKLTPKHLGPFKIIQEISPVAYQLELPANWKIHDMFHASLLTPYHETPAHGPNFTRPPPDLIDGEDEYEVEQIITHQQFGRLRRLQYLIKWKGYPESDNIWEPADQVHSAMNGYRRQSCRACTIKVRARERGMSHRTQKIEDEHTTLIYSGRDYKILST